MPDEPGCPVCGRPLEWGYGLAGGGIGMYVYCDEHGVVEKWSEEDDTCPTRTAKA